MADYDNEAFEYLLQLPEKGCMEERKMRKRGEEGPILPWDKKGMPTEFGGFEEAQCSNIRRRAPRSKS